jgi:uracil-DNA glycosylase
LASQRIKLFIEALKDQREIFGDLFLQDLDESFQSAFIRSSEGRSINNAAGAFDAVLFREEFQNAESLDELNSQICGCVKCALGATRTKFVFGVGNPRAVAMLIGEAPGADEDAQGEPFVGRAGKLLNDILKAVNLKREDVYIANILKCRPPNNRDPLPAEEETCKPYLQKQIGLIRPKIILCLGRIAANGLLNKKLSLTALRENIYELDGIRVMATYHPAALLRNPNWKRGCWEDFKKFRKLYDELSN